MFGPYLPQRVLAAAALGLAAMLLASVPVARGQATNAAEKLYDLKFSSATLDQVLKFYCEMTDRTALEAPGNKATINLRSQTRLTREETMQALKAVLAMNNVALVEVGDKFVKVVPIASVQQEGLTLRPTAESTNLPDADIIISELIQLKHIDPGEAQKAISGFMHPYGKIMPLERINSILVADTMMNLNRMHEILDQVDQPLELKEQLFPYKVKFAKATDIKTKLLEIIQETKGQEKAPTPTVARPAPSGPPGVIRAPILTPRRATTQPETTTETSEDLSGKMIRGDVRIVADDRTGVLIIITRPENMVHLRTIIEAFDVAIEPDVIVKIYRLEYATADDVASMLNTLIGAAAPKGTVKPPAGTKPETPGSAAENKNPTLEEFVRQQREAAQSAQAAQQQSAGNEALKLKIGELSAENIKILADKRSNALIIMAPRRDMLTLEGIVHDMDIQLSQVMIEAIILNVTLTKGVQSGVDWLQRSMVAYNRNADGSRKAVLGFAGEGGGGASIPQNALNFSGASSFGSSAGGLTYYLTAFGLNLDAVIHLAANDTRARLISSPIILTSDNEEAKINVTTKRYFYKGQTPTSVGGVIAYVPNVEAQDVGLKLSVTPHINEKKFVVIKLQQEQQNVTAESQAIEGAGTWPIVASREFSASVAVRSGETIVLGGLSENENVRNQTKIPILGDIPLIGMLFKSWSTSDRRQEVLVFITPYVLNTPEEIEAAARREQAALDEDGHWTKGWSASKLGDEPPREETDSNVWETASTLPRLDPQTETNLLQTTELSGSAGGAATGVVVDTGTTVTNATR